MQVIVDGACILAVMLFLNESRGSVLLSRKARVLNCWYEAREKVGYKSFDCPCTSDVENERVERLRWKVKSDEERETVAKIISISVYRPFRI